MKFQAIKELSPLQILLVIGGFVVTCLLFSLLLITTQVNQIVMLHVHAHSFFPEWMWAVLNLLGDAWVVLLILLIVDHYSGNFTSWIFKAWTLGALLVQTMKVLVPMARPASTLGSSQLHLIDHPPLVGSSMPSGHALAATTCALMLIAHFVQHKKRGDCLLIPILMLGLLASWARVAVGAHWPSDVIAGIGLALAVVTASFIWEKKYSWNDWFQKPSGKLMLFIVHTLIAIYLVFLPSEFLFVKLMQFLFASLSAFKSWMLLRGRLLFYFHQWIGRQ